MNVGRRQTPDERMLQTAARRAAFQIVGAIAVVVIVAGVVAWLIGTSAHHRGGPFPHAVDPDHDDEVIVTTLLIAGAVGIVVAGLAGLLIARRAVAPLGDALARQRRFVADAGHELRTPLTVLHTRAQLIARRMSKDDPARPAVEQLLDDSRLLGGIIDDLLTSAQLGNEPHGGEPVDLAAMADDVVASMMVLAQEREIELVAHHPSGVATVRGTPTALGRALTALIDNALEHTPAGGHITVETVEAGTDVILTVADSGTGIGPDDPDRLVERFARGSENSAGRRRFGLGLALVQEIARSHGGVFTLSDGPEIGAVAKLRIPRST